MRWVRNNRGDRSKPGRLKLLGWMLLVSFVFGLIEFGEPLELTLRSIRDKIRAQPVSGEVVVVGIDHESISEAGPWPWNRRELARLTERIFESGAERIFFEMHLEPMEQEGDQALARVVKRHPGRVFVASAMDVSANVGTSRAILPMPALADSVEPVSVMRWMTHWNSVVELPYRKLIDGRSLRSIESAISGVEGRPDEQFPVDYSYRISSVPYLSARHFAEGSGINPRLAGKSVLVGLNMSQTEGAFLIPGQGRAAGIFVSALGAETLMAGRPMVLGWLPAWLLAAGLSVYLVRCRRLRRAIPAGFLGIFIFLAAPLLLEDENVFVEVMPALFLLVAILGGVGWLWFERKKRRQGAINALSGLRTVNALLQDEEFDTRLLVAVRLRRFAEIVSTLRGEGERDFLQQILTRLSMGAGDAEMLHGDDGNFFWLLPGEELASVVDRFKALQLIFRTPIPIGERRVDVDIAFGVDRETHMTLSNRLASALAAAHAAGEEGACWKVHDPSSTGKKEWTLSLLGELDEAIDNGGLWVAYQPKMALATNATVGAEALVRWTHSKRGPIDPGEFVTIAERHGRIDRLTSFVLNDAAKVAAEAIGYDSAFKVAVNISPRLLTGRAIIQMVEEALDRHHLPPACLILEITETASMLEGDSPFALLDELRAMGVGLSIDDYGTGMSTLDYIRRMPATELKIDRRFTAALLSGPEDQAVVRSTIDLAHMLGMQVVAEGIETDDILQLLRKMGCEIGQGYHIGRPMRWDSLMTEIWPRIKQLKYS